MNNPLFTGVCTALVTPFHNHSINYPLLQRLIQRQIDAGVKAIVLAGTTGESATLSDNEKIRIIKAGKEYSKGKCLIIAGTGSNCTSHAVELGVKAEEAGADGLLVVSPYYNKATPKGLMAHYIAISSAVSIPIIMYNVPSRTGVDIPVSVYKQLSRIPNIVGTKEATTDIVKIARIISQCPDRFSVWCGNDDQAVSAIALGGKGVISVLSNIYPIETKEMCDAALDGDFDTAAALQCEMLPLIETLFSEVNPIPVKEAMRQIGFDCGGCRLPLCAPNEQTVKKLLELI